MSDEISENSEVYNHYLELSKPTEEDFKRVFTEEELKKLCLKHKCKVNMWRWNIVNEYRIVFTDSGRFQRWSARKRLRMLAKAVNKMMPSVLYDEEEIRKTRKEEWGEQLKENILSLNFWKRQQLRNTRLQVSESDDIDRALKSQCEVNTESMNVIELSEQSEESSVESNPTMCGDLDEEVQLEIEVNTESMNPAALLTQSQTHAVNISSYCSEFRKKLFSHIQADIELINTEELNREGGPIANRKVAPGSAPQSEDGNILIAEIDAEYLLDGDSEDSVETVLNIERQNTIAAETLHSEEVAPEIQNMYAVNTISMTIDSQMSTQSQDLPMLQSEDVIPPNYEHFKNIIPLTSTQSQVQESEELIVA